MHIVALQFGLEGLTTS